MRNIVKSTTVIATMAGMAMVFSPHTASATLISIGECTGTCTSVTTMGTDSGTGFASVTGSMGAFTLTSAVATGSPILPQPTLNTSSIDVSSSGAGVLDMFVTEQGLTSPLGISNFLSSFTFNLFSGLGITSVTEETFISTGNGLYTGTLLSSATDSSGGLSSSSATAASPLLTGPYSETVEYIITANSAGSTNDTVNMTASPVSVPEPASVWFLAAGLGILSLLMRGRRFLRQAAGSVLA